MYYIIQKNVFKDPRYDEIFFALDALKLPYEKIAFKPNSMVFDYETNRKDIFVYGSVKLAKVTSEFDWNPGSFYGGNHQFESYSKGYGRNTINHDSYITNFTDQIDWSKNKSFFIKPSKDAKVFTGKVFDESEWGGFVHDHLNDQNNAYITASTLVQVSKPFELIKEARVWIVGQKVVTSSYYRFHDGAEFEKNVSNDGLEFAQEMAGLYNVADAYVMDIALTFDGWKIMEVNCINSAGFYNGDVKEIVRALEVLYC